MIKKIQDRKKRRKNSPHDSIFTAGLNHPVPNPASVNKQQDLKVNDLLVTSSDALPP